MGLESAGGGERRMAARTGRLYVAAADPLSSSVTVLDRGLFVGIAAFCYPIFSVNRALLNALSSFLLVASYLWGGCVSCDQFFMLPGSKGQCCEKRRCKNPAKKSSDRTGSTATQQDCQTMPLERSSSAHSSDFAAPLSAIAVSAGPAADLIDLTFSQARAVADFDLAAGSLPDIPLTNSALLI